MDQEQSPELSAEIEKLAARLTGIEDRLDRILTVQRNILDRLDPTMSPTKPQTTQKP